MAQDDLDISWDERKRLNVLKGNVHHIHQDAKDYEFVPGEGGYLSVTQKDGSGFTIQNSKKIAKVIPHPEEKMAQVESQKEKEQ